jgi:single-strand DNA-binding protein
MSRGFNRVIIMGNLARDPDVRYTPNKQKVARITVAVGKQWKNRVTGELQSQTDFIPVTAWSSLADLCDRFLRKGKPVLIEGRIQVRDYDDAKTGTHKCVTDVVAENMVLLPSGRKEDEYGEIPAPRAAAPAYQAQRPAPQSYQSADVGSLRDDIDFEEDFPLDFSEMPDSAEGTGAGEVDVPF